MRLNRREFVRFSTMSVVAAAASCSREQENRAGQGTLNIRVKGLALVERLPSSVQIHLIDGAALGMGAHEAVLSVSSGIINAAGTTAPSQPDPHDSTRRVFNLTGRNLTLDTGITGSAALVINEDDIGPQPPPDDNWRSLKLAANFRTLCGATRITDRSKVAASLKLDRGNLQALRPQTNLGRGTVWSFTRQMPDGSTLEIARQAMTDSLECRVPTAGRTATFMIGTQPLVVDVRDSGDVLLRNLPPAGVAGTCTPPPGPCVDHLAAMYDLVDFQFKPVGKAVVIPPMESGVEPNYCPPGFI